MKQEDKDLLMKDLCARLTYGVKFKYGNRSKVCKILSITPIDDNVTYFDTYVNHPKKCDIDDVRPYLFPLSSMTREQELYLYFNTKFRIDKFGTLVVNVDADDNYLYTDISDYISIIDWLNKNHFDYRGLIEKGLAIDATGLNIY